jgi:hypothetical protein
MIFTTLQPAGGAEKTLADWGISHCTREVANQAHDHVAFDLNAATDATDPFPFGTQITLRIGRTPASGSGTSASGLPLSGITSWTGGRTWFIGWRVDNVRTGQAALEKFDYKFAGPWEFFFERLVFRKPRLSWDGVKQIVSWQDRITLGLSMNALCGAQDTVPGSTTTCLMSIAQQIKEIAAYVITQTTAAYGSAQLQFDALTADTAGNYNLLESPGPACLIPDYITGYSVAGKTSATANLETVLRAPLDTVTSITCAEAMRKMCRWIGPFGSPVVWFDYTTSPPTLHINTRDALAAVSLPFPAPDSGPLTGPNGTFGAVASKIKRRDDLIPSCVGLDFSITGTWNGQQYNQVIRDVAGTIAGTVYEGVGVAGALVNISTFATGSPTYLGGSAGSSLANSLEALAMGFEGQTTTIDMEGGNSQISYCTIATALLNFADPSSGAPALAFWTRLFPELSTAGNPSFAANAPAITVIDDAGNAGTIGTDGNGNPTVTFAGDAWYYSYLLTDGQIAPWMLAGNASGGQNAKTRQCTITAYFAHTENSPVLVSGSPVNVASSIVAAQAKHARVTLTSIPGGTYQRQLTSPGEVVPYGLAGYIYNIEKIPQYEGTYTLQETEITDQCPLGNNLNFTGSLAEWATMAACVQQISYDLDAARTTLTFGPAAHLGPKDFVERLRTMRPLRYYNLQNQNPTNDPTQQKGAALGNNVAQRGPNNSAPANDMTHWPISLLDEAANAALYNTGTPATSPGPPGVTLDTRSIGQPNYGTPAGRSAPTLPSRYAAAPGTGAVAGAVTVAAGVITAVANPPSGHGGSGYTIPPLVQVSGSGGGGGAIITANLGSGATAGQVVSFTVVNGGGNYSGTMTISITTPFIRESLSDVVTAGNNGGQDIMLREVNDCYDFGDGNGVVGCYRTVLCSSPYKTSIV